MFFGAVFLLNGFKQIVPKRTCVSFVSDNGSVGKKHEDIPFEGKAQASWLAVAAGAAESAQKLAIANCAKEQNKQRKRHEDALSAMCPQFSALSELFKFCPRQKDCPRA